MRKYIEIYDGESKIGFVETESEFPNESVFELIDVTIKEKKVVIFHILDMDYGIIIPTHIAETIKRINQEVRNGDR